MDDKNTFYTFNTYLNNNLITASMEDYIEMIYRLSLDQGYTRVSELSHSLNVTAPSTNNMVKINHHDIQDFSFQKIYGAYCIFFEYQKKEYYFYLNDSFSTRVLGNVFGTDKIDYSRKNLSYLETMNFMGLLKSR